MDVVLAVDVGGTKMAAGLMTMAGELIDRDQVPVDREGQADALFDALDAMVQHQLERAREHHGATPVVVGVGAAGPVGENVETVSPLNIAAWRDFPLRARLAASTGLAVYGDLDAKALALAEGWLGAAQGRENFLAMVVGTG